MDFYIEDETTESFYVVLEGDGERHTYEIYYRLDSETEGNSKTGSFSSDTKRVRISGLQRNTTYAVNVKFDGGSWVGKQTITTLAIGKPTIYSTSIDGTEVTVEWKPPKYAVYYEFTSDGWEKDWGPISSTTTKTSVLSFDNYNTKYKVYLTVYDEDDNSNSISFNITTGELSKFEWTSTELNAFRNQGKTNVLTATRFKKFINQVNSVFGAAKTSGYVPKKWTLVSSWVISNGQYLANEILEIMETIQYICDNTGASYSNPGENKIATGKIIYGYYFIDMANALNEVVDIINGG